MAYQIEQFNICSSSADEDVFFNEAFRSALTKAINHQLDKYKAEHPDKDINPGKLTLFFYPESAGYWFEIKDRRNDPEIYLIDSMADWLDKNNTWLAVAESATASLFKKCSLRVLI